MKTRVFYSLISAHMAGITEHAQTQMAKLADDIGFRVLGSRAQSLVDGWEFWVEHEKLIEWPSYIRSVDWR